MPNRKIAREKKKSFKGWAKGPREDLVLEPMWQAYCDAAQRGIAQRRRVLEQIYERFHFQIPPDITAKDEIYAPLPVWTPDIIYDPFEGLATEEEREARRKNMDETNKRIEKYYAYRYARISRAPAFTTDAAANPYNVLLNQLCGLTRPSRGRSDAQHYQNTHAEELIPIYKREWAAAIASGEVMADAKQTGNWREGVARKELAKMSAEDQKYWKDAAKEYNATRVKEYKKAMAEPPSETPEARQAAIDAFPKWAAPILQGVYARTGLHLCLMLGGPMPKYNGQLSVVCMSAGVNHQASRKPYPHWPGFQSIVVPHFKSYLPTAYTQAECDAASLNIATYVPDSVQDAAVPVISSVGLLQIDPEEPSDCGSDTDDDDDVTDDESSQKKKKSKKTRAKPKKTAAAKKGKAKAAQSDAEVDAPAPSVAPKKKAAGGSKRKTKAVESSSDEADESDDDVAPPKKKTIRPRTTVRSIRPTPLAGCRIASSVPELGSFDVTRPHETFSRLDPPGEFEGQRRLLWLRERYRQSKVHEMPSSHRRLLKEWDAQHSVSADGRVVKNVAAPTTTASASTPAAPTTSASASASAAPTTTESASTSAAPTTAASTTTATPSTSPAAVKRPQPKPVRRAGPAPAPSGAHVESDPIGLLNSRPSAPPEDHRPSTPPPVSPSGAAKRPRPMSTPPSPQKTPAPKKMRTSQQNMTEKDFALAEMEEEEDDPMANDEEAGQEEEERMDDEGAEKGAEEEKADEAMEKADEEMEQADEEMEQADEVEEENPGALMCPPDAPEWITANLALLNLPELGEKYVAAVAAWLKLEEKWEFSANKGTNSKGSAPRPELLDRWIRGGRAPRVKKNPAVIETRAFEKEVWKWWTGLQPSWRKINADGRPSEDREVDDSGDWGVLGIHGQNGLLNAIAVLCWWGVALKGRSNRSWDRLLDEVIWVCEEQLDSV